MPDKNKTNTHCISNILATISDRKIGYGTTPGTQVSYWSPDIYSASDYYPFGCTMPGRVSNGTEYRFGYNTQERVDEISGAENHTTALYWEYDTRLGRRWNLDPKPNISVSNYAVNGNSPIWMTDPLGDKEYKNYEKYKKALGDKAIAEKDWKGQDGNWLKSDRTSWTKDSKDNRFAGANAFNITQKTGSNEYDDLGQRKAFYSWFQSATEAKGFETRWSGGASQAVNKLEYLVDGWGTASGIFGYSNNEIESWVKSGNKLILDDAWKPLMDLYAGSPLKGADAYNWDAKMLLREQQTIDPSYWNLSNGTLTTLENSLKKNYIFSSFMSGPKFDGKASILSVTDRWVYGMTLMNYKVSSANAPIPAVCPQSPAKPKR